ncbi:MAG: CoB--CoM heterodisulfide reductase iron-sulfur subunit B family protein [Chloroflexota bacterium]
MRLNYYPGCSASATAQEYDLSTRAVFAELGYELDELEDWNCCGASSGHVTDRMLALALPTRNLAQAQATGNDLLTPCAACYSRHKAADHALRTADEKRVELEEIVQFEYTGQVRVRPPLEVIATEVGMDAVAARVTNPLTGLKVVSYYGCLLVRPPEVVEFDSPDYPVVMDRLLVALGADARPWGYATDCCGGGLNLTRSQTAERLVSRLIRFAREAGADALVTACPLCQMSLEMRQTDKEKMPTVYFTELMGLAFGLQNSSKWWRKHLIDPRPWLKNNGVLA